MSGFFPRKAVQPAPTGRTVVLKVVGYDTTSQNPMEHVVNGIEVGTNKPINISLSKAPPPKPVKEGENVFLRPEIALFATPARTGKKVATAVGGLLIAEGVTPRVGSNTHEATWLSVGSNGVPDPSVGEDIVLSGKLIELRPVNRHVSGKASQIVNLLDTQGTQIKTAAEFNTRVSKILGNTLPAGEPFAFIRRTEGGEVHSTRVYKARIEVDGLSNTETSEKMIAASLTGESATAIRALLETDKTSLFEVISGVQLYVGKDSLMAKSLFLKPNPKRPDEIMSKGFTPGVVSLRIRPPVNGAEDGEFVRAIFRQTKTSQFDPAGRDLEKLLGNIPVATNSDLDGDEHPTDMLPQLSHSKS